MVRFLHLARLSSDGPRQQLLSQPTRKAAPSSTQGLLSERPFLAFLEEVTGYPTEGSPEKSGLLLHGYMENKPLGLQIFIGTADERILKPHAFYQVHRITGKTVTTTSYEKIVGNTKVLEIPLEPKNNMRATIDCAGILKLRNADIELRKGETDIGRKNTRVRLVFRVHIPESSGRIVSLQTASNPIECCKLGPAARSFFGKLGSVCLPPGSRVFWGEKDPKVGNQGKHMLKTSLLEITEFPCSAQQTPLLSTKCWSWWLPHPGLGFEPLKMFLEGNLQ
ncbi:hypothetical protein P7K49_009911 [Saguinus oedipus]|uniref:RHD domain-containing protein n=1 Tax=Saguinus oedipus TaxID=9490 RepID=A0ABQ9VLB2_SAGOE|nr:hypothetical protein P7K49_009911 [Saguinus oedipus]